MIDDVIIVGAGVAGMSAARVLVEKGYKVRVLESQRYVGGRLHSVALGDLTVEVGAQFITNFYPKTLHLASELGMSEQLVRLVPRLAGAKGGTVEDLQSFWSIASGRTLPYRAIPFVLREILVVIAKWHRLDPTSVWKSAEFDDRALAGTGATAGERIFVSSLLEPALDQFMYWRAEETSAAFSPIFIKAALIFRRVLLFRDGFEAFVSRGMDGIPVECGAEVAAVSQSPDGFYTCTMVDGRAHQCKAVILACDASSASKLWPNFLAPLASFIENVRYSSTVVVSSRVRREVPGLAYGIMNRALRPVDVAATTVLARRGSPVVPEGENVIQAFSTESAAARLMNCSDEDVLKELNNSIVREYGRAFNLVDNMQAFNVHRWSQALPKFEAGYLRALSQVQAALSGPAPVVPAGDYLSGPFIEGAVQSGTAAAFSVQQYLDLG